ncbi:MAG: DEAD/DEAH box helicase, partial [Pyrinomonadaceae bacterium]
MPDNQRVKVRADPGRVGRTTGKYREAAGKRYVQIEFPDGTTYLSEDQVEPADELIDLFDVLRRGQLGRASDLRRLLTHVRIGGRLANLIYSMETTYTDFYAYQFKPVLKLLETPTKGILIADEVGLGKTIEAGLIWTELRSRVDARRLIVVCPAVLREKWRMELARRFGIQAETLNAEETLRKLRWALEEQPGSGFHIVASMQGLRPRRDWGEDEQSENPASKLAKYLQERSEDAPFIDLLVVDEAHYLRNPATKTHELGELLSSVAERVVFLSATPIHLDSEDLYQLLSLLDPDTFNSPELFDSILEANEPLVRARELVMSGRADSEELLQLLTEAKNNPYLAESRQLASLLADLPGSKRLREKETISELAFRLDTINLLSHVVTRTRKREVSEWRVRRQPVAEKVTMTAPEQAFYEKVTEVIREFC